MGGNDIVMRSMLSERRAQESSADQTGLRLLEATHQSGRGMQTTFERFAEQEFWQAKDLDPFVRSHPVAAERLNQLREKVAASPYVDQKDPPELQLRHDMMRAKLDGHMLSVQLVFNRYPASDNSLPARYARAIARNCSGSCAQALPEVDALIRDRPDNPYFWELKGELLVKAGKYTEAIAPLRKAVALLDKLKHAKPWVSSSQTQIMLGRALVSSEDPRLLDEAIAMLTNVLGADKPLWQGEDDDWLGWWQLAVAYERKGNTAEALLATARKLFYSGGAKDIQEAQIYAKRAQKIFTRGSRGWLIAEDIVTYKIPSLSCSRRPQRHTATEGMLMPARSPASLIDALASLKGAALLVPAILLVGATLALGQSSAPSSTPLPQPAATTEPGRIARPGDGLIERIHPGPAQGARDHHQGRPAQQPGDHAGGAERARVQDGQDPGRAHGGGHQGARRRALSAGGHRRASATSRATSRSSSSSTTTAATARRRSPRSPT